MSESDESQCSTSALDREAAFELVACGLAMLDPGGRIVHVNATFARWLQAPVDALIGKAFRDLLTTPGKMFYETTVAPALRLGDIEEVALDFRIAGADPLPALINAAEVRDAAGALLGIQIAIMRGSGRRGYERDLLKREASATRGLADARETADLREQFIAVLGHDLRNPLASIVGATRLLRRELPSEKASRVIDLMEGSVDRMAGLIDDVMDFARGRLGGGIILDLNMELLEPTLRQVVAELEISQPGRTILWDCHLPTPIRFDRTRLAQLVSNLIGNALTHGDPKAPVRLQAHISDQRLTVAVVNAGAPIPPAAMDRLFQPFFRGEVRPSRQGLGLGLHIASEIAKAHGGELSMTSSADETRFVLTMPTGIEAAGAAAELPH